MAAVSIQVGNVTVTFEDEDRGAKSLGRLALKTLEDIVENCSPEDEGDDEDVLTHEPCGEEIHQTNMKSHEVICHG